MAIELLGTTPTAGTVISSTEILQFDIRSTVAFRRVVISVEFEGFQFREVAYEGEPSTDGLAGYENLYSGRSGLDQITDAGWTRYRFRVGRSPAWPASPSVSAIAYNVNGEEI